MSVSAATRTWAQAILESATVVICRSGRGFCYFSSVLIANSGATYAAAAMTATVKVTTTLGAVTEMTPVVVGGSLVLIPTATVRSLWQGKAVTESIKDGITSPYWLSKGALSLPGKACSLVKQYFSTSEPLKKEEDLVQVQLLVCGDEVVVSITPVMRG